jgi:lysozyme
MTVRLNKAMLSSAGALVVAAAPFIANFEGWRNYVYGDDLAKGSYQLATVCAGHTDNIGTARITKSYYTDNECTALEIKDIQYTDRQLVVSTGSEVVNSMPVDRRVALIDFIYNLGLGTYNKSGIPVMLKEGRTVEACQKILLYDKGTVDGHLEVVAGLHRRRVAEYQMCIE